MTGLIKPFSAGTVNPVRMPKPQFHRMLDKG